MKTHSQNMILMVTAGLLCAATCGLADAGEATTTERPGFWRRWFGKLTWEETIAVVETPRQICAKVRHRVRYEEDLGDTWLSGRDTWRKGGGDCEDMAQSVVDICRAKGIKAAVLVFYPKGSWEAHAVAVGEWEGRYWISSNGWYEKVASLDEARTRVARDMRWRGKEIMTTTLAALTGQGAPRDKNVNISGGAGNAGFFSIPIQAGTR